MRDCQSLPNSEQSKGSDITFEIYLIASAFTSQLTVCSVVMPPLNKK